jgi:flagellar motor protein MotB
MRKNKTGHRTRSVSNQRKGSRCHQYPLIRTAHSLAGIIEEHTDDLPLQSAQYSTNVELSAARASRVYSFFLAEESVRPEQIAVAGYGEYRPAASKQPWKEGHATGG